jgi:drug/metabolite transporter (DMT)-like permease
MTIRLLAETGEAAHALPMSPGWFGLIGIAFFGLLLAVTLAFRNVSNKH